MDKYDTDAETTIFGERNTNNNPVTDPYEGVILSPRQDKCVRNAVISVAGVGASGAVGLLGLKYDVPVAAWAGGAGVVAGGIGWLYNVMGYQSTLEESGTNNLRTTESPLIEKTEGDAK